MVTFAKKATLALALAASALASATPAMADPYYGGHHRGRGGDTAGAAIVGGIIGIALGAIIASSSNNDRKARCGRNGFATFPWGAANRPLI